MQAILEILKEAKSMTSAVGGLFFVVALIGAVVHIIKHRSRDLSIKLLGSIFVIALCLAADNTFIYGIGLFIVATLVTELEFLEKLAAIIWGHKEYWQYLESKAKKSKVKEKLKEEAQVEVEREPEATRRERQKLFLKKAMEFEQEVLKLLGSSDGLFPKHHLKTEVELSSYGRRLLIDAVAEGPKYFYLIEVKTSTSINILVSTSEKLRNYAIDYGNYLRERGVYPSIRFLIVVPNFPGCPDFINEVPILRYDSELKKFVNKDSIYRWIYEEEE